MRVTWVEVQWGATACYNMSQEGEATQWLSGRIVLHKKQMEKRTFIGHISSRARVVELLFLDSTLI